MKYLTKQHIITLHLKLAQQTGGAVELINEDLLDSAVNAPFQTFDGDEIYPTIIEKAVRLGYGLIRNHTFADGNKRIGAHAMLVFLALNKINPEYTDKELTDIIMETAKGNKSYDDLLEWVRSRSL